MVSNRDGTSIRPTCSQFEGTLNLRCTLFLPLSTLTGAFDKRLSQCNKLFTPLRNLCCHLPGTWDASGSRNRKLWRGP